SRENGLMLQSDVIDVIAEEMIDANALTYLWREFAEQDRESHLLFEPAAERLCQRLLMLVGLAHPRVRLDAGLGVLCELVQGQLDHVVTEHQRETSVVSVPVAEMFGSQVELFNRVGKLRQHDRAARVAAGLDRGVRPRFPC